MISGDIAEAIGEKGESIFKDALLEYRPFKGPLFRAAFLGPKWPAADYYVELIGNAHWRSGLFAQVKSTSTVIHPGSAALKVKLSKAQRKDLSRLPGPTYLFGVHEPTRRVFVLAIGAAAPNGIYNIPLRNELTAANLKLLYDEVKAFWEAHGRKPEGSVFV